MASPNSSTLLLCAGGGYLLGSGFGSYRKLSEGPWPWVAAGLTISIVAFVKAFAYSQASKQCILSPRATLLPTLNSDETASLSYPPDAFPGSRDVDSPYGSLRVYEWGPVDGEKVLLIHGISTPCLALGGVAQALVDQGRRVMLFDLWGRGYSDTPQDLPQDTRLFTSAILLALTSSNICWTGSSSFTLVGYSLGGGIATAFTSFFPHLVSNLVLIAPSGLLRKQHISSTSKLLYSSGVLPEFWVESFVNARLNDGPSAAIGIKKSQSPTSLPAEEELLGGKQDEKQTSDVLSAIRPEVAARDAMAWQVQHHEGFIKAFVSSIRNGPIHQQHARWRLVGENFFKMQSLPETGEQQDSRQHARILIICGDQDSVVIRDEVFEDAKHALGSQNVQLHSLDAGHELPMTHSREIVQTIGDFLLQRASKYQS